MNKLAIQAKILKFKDKMLQNIGQYPTSIKIVEVGPRDGLQNEKQVMKEEFKINLINDLFKTGIYHIEGGSFVSPKWIPQMANSLEILEKVQIPDQLIGKAILSALVPNMKGLETALKSKANEIAVFTAASESFTKKNINCTIEESFEKFKPVIKQALDNNIQVRGYVSCVMGCPYEGDINPGKVRQVTKQLLDMGCYEVSLGDTIGAGDEDKTQKLLDEIVKEVPIDKLAAHFHDTNGKAIENILIAFENGIKIFDCSVGGLGGCPYAKKSVGNVCTENVVEMFESLNVKTGVNLAQLKQVKHIQVYVRCRPLNHKEIRRNEKSVVKVTEEGIKVDVTSVGKMDKKGGLMKHCGKVKNFQFKNYFGPDTTTTHIHNNVSKKIVLSSLRGINSTVFVYGQTGSGKTYTITGGVNTEKNIYHKSQREQKSKSPLKKSPGYSSRRLVSKTPQKQKSRSRTPKKKFISKDGLLFQSLKTMFDEIEQGKQKNEDFMLSCSYIEIYQEQVYDLLREEFTDEEKLPVFEDMDKNDFQVKGAKEEIIQNYEDAIKILERGETNRHFAVTNLNHNSSRSHSIFRIFIQYVSAKEEVYQSVCNFVDLAGSEKVSKFEDEDDFDKSARIQESKSINKSLFFLTQIINLMGKQDYTGFVPYRNSPLTKILKNSLGGNAKTAIILCINPSYYNLEQTLSTLSFGKLAMNIQNQVQKNKLIVPQEDFEKVIKDYENQIQELEIKMLRASQTEGLLSQISDLQRQKQEMIAKYQNLLKLSQIFQKKRKTQQNELYIIRNDINVFSCGIVSTYKLTSQKTENSMEQFDVNYFIQNREYNRELFEQDIIKQKNKKIKKLEKQLQEQQKLFNERFQAQNQERNYLKRLLLVFMNNNVPDMKNLSKNFHQNFIENSLLQIENFQKQKVNQISNSDTLKIATKNDDLFSIDNMINFMKQSEDQQQFMNYSITNKDINNNEFSNLYEEPRIPQIEQMEQLSEIQLNQDFQNSLDFSKFDPVTSLVTNSPLKQQDINDQRNFKKQQERINIRKKITAKFLLDDQLIQKKY